MHTFSETGAGVPAFLAKLWRLVEDPETNNLIYWSKDGNSFIIQNQAQFAREILPLNYKHNNMASFIRQLNMYGFHKITSIDNGGLKFDRDDMEFSHSCFRRGSAYLLEHIKRKIANTKTLDLSTSGNKTEAVSKVLNEVKQMRGRQDSLDSRFSVIKQENEALWREIASLRQKHMKQQQIVNKLIQFLVTIVQPSRNMSGVKRNFQLMINDAPKNVKIRKRNESESGPIIHELTEELLDEVAEAGADLDMNDDPPTPRRESSPANNFERPRSNVSNSNNIFENSNESMEDTYITAIPSNNSPLVYHISEIPEDIIPCDSPQTDNFMDETVLNTPLVQQELFRKQESQRKNSKLNQPGPSLKLLNKSDFNTINIKTENELDPMIFLDTAASSSASNPSFDQDLKAAANTNNPAASLSFTSNIGGKSITNYCNPENNSENSKNDPFNAQKPGLYNTSEFIGDDLGSELFEGNTVIGNINMTRNNNESTNEITHSNMFDASSGPSSSKTSFERDNNDLALAKYNSKTAPMNDDTILKFNSPEDFNQHLDTVQDDLDNLKDFLRSDSYSLDGSSLLNNNNSSNSLDLVPNSDSKNVLKNGNTSNRLNLSTSLDNDFILKNINTSHCFNFPSSLDTDILMKLFNDSDVLSAYGLNSDNSQDNSKKGSEMIAYQPYLSEFSDIFDMNSKNEDIYKNDKSQPSTSVLNTPRPRKE